MKSEKVRTSLLFTFSLLLFTSAARAADLPAGYTAVDHIVAPRGAFIDTDYRPNQNTRVVMDVTVQGAGEYWFGCWDRNYNDGAFAFGNDGTGVYAGYGNQGGTVGSVVANGRHSVELDKNVVKVDGGTTYECTFDASFGREGPLANNLYLFAQNRMGTPAVAGLQTSIICYGCKIYESGMRVRDFVPCVAANGRTGLYDLVEQRFCVLHLRSLPSGYKTVDHVIAPRGAYIDTGYKPNQNTRTMMDVTVQGKAEYWFSVSGANYTTDAYALCNDDWQGIYYAVDDNGGSFKSEKTADGCVPNGRHTVGITPYSLLVDGEIWKTKEQKGGFQLENNLYLFASHAAVVHEAYTPTTQTTIICHGCLISESGTPVRDFVPCVRTADAVAGLYDTVEGKFYENSGSGIIGILDDAFPLGRELASGTYEITESFTFAAPMGESALKIADRATVTLDIAAGVTVTVYGGDAAGATGAGAGIEVPANATLRVTGWGKLVAYGGKGANGCDGMAGGNGCADGSTGNFTSGAGGAGGWGGGGAGAGIGGRGGNGGAGGGGGASVTSYDWKHEDQDGNAGSNGGNGGNGGTCGMVSVEGLVTVVAYGGATGLDGAGGVAGTRIWAEGTTYWFSSFGGGGGGSGAKGGAAADIGGGGAGGSGGGGGGSGAYVWGRESVVDGYSGWGGGGNGAARGGAGGAISSSGGNIGLPGACGGSGSLTVAYGAAAYAKEGRYSVGWFSETVEIFYDNGKLLWVSGGTSSNLAYNVVNNDTATLGNGWYAVKGTVSRGKIAVNGTSNLVLLHGALLTASGVSHEAGISVPARNTLNIFGVESGSLTVKGSNLCAGIGGGYDAGYDGGTVTINGGTVSATGGQYGAGIGGGSSGAGGTVTINGGTVTATGSDGGAGIGGGREGARGSLTVGRRVYKIDDNHWREGVSVSFVVPDDLRVSSSEGADRSWMEGNRYFAVNQEPGRTLTFAFEVTDPGCRLVGNASLTVGPVLFSFEIKSSQLPYAEEYVMESLGYVLSNGEVGGAKNVYPIHNRAELSVLSQSWYQVTGNLTRSELTVVGEVNLILCDGADLTVNGGIRIGEGNKLNIFCQEGGTGRLVVIGSDTCAGIAGTITINGGTVTATGGDAAAGGSGAAGIDGTVTINGGTVTAQGGESAAGIVGPVTINGGTVTARGGERGAGIGGGYSGAGGTVTINGGMVTATGGKYGAGIGGGSGYPVGGAGGTVTINGGTVKATGSDGGAGIGGGVSYWHTDTGGGAGGTVTINGGTVMATGSNGGAGIGGGCGGADGTVTLDMTRVVVVKGAYGNGSSYVKIVEKPTCEGGTIAWSDAANAWVVTPNEGVTAVSISGLPEGAKVAVPPTVKQVGGVPDEQIKVYDGETDVTARYLIHDGVISTFETFDDGRHYLESTAENGQYIDTGYCPTVDTRIVADFNSMARSANWAAFFGVRKEDKSESGILLRYFRAEDAFNAWFCNLTNNEVKTAAFAGRRIAVELKAGSLTIDTAEGTTAYEIPKNGTAPYAGPIYVFCENEGDSPRDYQAMRLYSFRIYDTVEGVEKPVRDLVPFQTTDGTEIAGLYDRVTEKCFVNQGGGSLTLGVDEDAPGPTCEGGTIEWSDAANAWVVTPSAGVTAVTIGGLPEGAKLAVKCGGYAVSSAAFVGFGEGKTEGVFSLALDENGVVNGVPVKPMIGDLDEGEPFTVGKGAVTVMVRAIPGLKYELRRADIVEAFCAAETAPPQKVVCETVATGTMVTLTDTEPPEGAAFYRVEVSVP